MLGEVLFSRHGPSCRKITRLQRQLRHRGLSPDRHTDRAAENGAAVDADGHVGLLAKLHHRITGKASHLGGKLCHPGAADHYIRQQLLGIGPVQGLPQIGIGVGGPNEHRDTNAEHDGRGQELPAVPPQIPTQLAAQDAGHQSRSCACAGAATRS